MTWYFSVCIIMNYFLTSILAFNIIILILNWLYRSFHISFWSSCLWFLPSPIRPKYSCEVYLPGTVLASEALPWMLSSYTEDLSWLPLTYRIESTIPNSASHSVIPYIHSTFHAFLPHYSPTTCHSYQIQFIVPHALLFLCPHFHHLLVVPWIWYFIKYYPIISHCHLMFCYVFSF